MLPISDFKQIMLGAIFAFGTICFQLPPLYFPENHSLAIFTDVQQSAKGLVIESIKRVELPSADKLTITTSQMEIRIGWDEEETTGSIAWLGNLQAEISYARFMKAGVKIIFKEGSEEGEVKIIWDGETQIVDLFAPSESSRTLVL